MTAFTWNVPVSGNWSTVADWAPVGAGPPRTASDSATFSPSGHAVVTLDVNETIGALTVVGSNTLAIGINQLTVTNAGGLAGTVTVTAGFITIAGGTLSATNGFSVASGAAFIRGTGTLIGTVAGAGRYQASGGTLRLESAVLASATGLQIANDSAAILEIDSTVASGAAITFAGAAGTLDLTDISGNLLQGFSGTIAGLNVGSSVTVPTNQIDLAGLAKADISAASLDTSSDLLTVTTTGGSFALQLSGSYAASTRVGLITDGAGTGTDLFLVAERTLFWNPNATGNWSTAADWTTSGGTPSGEPPSTIADSAQINAYGNNVTVTLDVNETIGQLAVFNHAQLWIGGNQLTVTNAAGGAGTVNVLGTAATIILSGGTLSATGGFVVGFEGDIAGYGILIGAIGGYGIYDTGAYIASGGTLRLESAVLADAVLQIENSSASILEIDSTVASGATITFAGAAGTLDLTDISSNLLQGFSGTIAGLNVVSSATEPTNQIDLAGLATADISAASLDTGTDIVTVTTAGGSFTLQLSGGYAAGTFVDWITDGAGTGSDLFLSSVACYCRGTLILTPDGEVAVERLAIGDLVLTLSGEARPIRWIGRRAYDGRFIAGNRQVLPIRITAGALADGVPARELWVSPGHSLYIDGVLVQAEHLVNGMTIAQAEKVEAVEYFHIELDEHDIVYAEGALAETFTDCDNRLMFRNGAEYVELYPDDERPSWEFCAPRLEWGADELTAIRAALLTRAETFGYALDQDADLHLLVDGEIVRPLSAAASVYRFAIPAGSDAVWLASRGSVPAELVPESRDIRRLGVPVERLLLCDANLSIEAWHGHAGLAEGFHEDEERHRWTDGLARLPDSLVRPFAGPFTLELHLALSDLAYQIPPPLDTAATA